MGTRLTEPEEVVLTEKAMTGRSAWERLFEEQVSSIAVELDGTSTTLEAALGQLNAPDRDVRRRSGRGGPADVACPPSAHGSRCDRL